MAMSDKSYRQLVAKCQERMEPGERIEHTLYAKVGTVPIKKNVASIAASAAVGAAFAAATGGAGIMMVTVFDKGRVYVALTDRSLLIFGGDRNRPGPRDLMAHLPRAAVTATVLRGIVAYKLRLDIAGHDRSIRLTFAPLPPSVRASGRYLAHLLRE